MKCATHFMVGLMAVADHIKKIRRISTAQNTLLTSSLCVQHFLEITGVCSKM
jgi:hypothetical protein